MESDLLLIASGRVLEDTESLEFEVMGFQDDLILIENSLKSL